MVGVKEVFVIELLKQTTDKAVLDKGPGEKGFWVRKWTTRMKLKNCNQQAIVQQLYSMIRKYLHLNANGFLRILPYCYSDSALRTSIWAWVFTGRQVLHCHVEAAASYV